MPPKKRTKYQEGSLIKPDCSGGDVFEAKEHEQFSKWVNSIEPEIKQMEQDSLQNKRLKGLHKLKNKKLSKLKQYHITYIRI